MTLYLLENRLPSFNGAPYRDLGGMMGADCRRSCGLLAAQDLVPSRCLDPYHCIPGLNLQGETSCACTDLSIGHRDSEKEGDCRQTSEPISPGTSSETILEIDKSSLKGISPTAGEHNDCSQEKKHGPALSLQSNTFLAVSQEDLLPRDKGLDVGPPGTQLPPSQAQVSIAPRACASSDVPEPPSSFRPKGAFPHHDTATSVAAICASVGTGTGHRTLGVHSAEPSEEQSVAQSSPDRGAAMPDSMPQARLPERPSSGQRSPGKTSVEMAPSGPSSISSQQEEAKAQGEFSSWGQYGCGEGAVHWAASGSEGGPCQAEGLTTPRSVTAPADQAQPSEVPEAPLRSIRKTSLEGMRKQTRVELSDTSSDDEDRLVIEI